MSAFEQIVLSKKEGIATIRLNQPESLNSFTKKMLSEITEALEDAKSDAKVRVIVITGTGRAFCTGQNLKERGETQNKASVDLGKSLKEKYVPIVSAIRESKKPVIGAINGIAAGAGANVALSCDLVIAKQSASFLQAFTRIGLMPDAGGTFFMTRNSGRQRAMGMALLAEPVPAQTAEAWGLIWKSVPDENFDQEIRDISEKLASGPTLAYAKTKEAILRAETTEFDKAINFECDLQSILGKSDDYSEGVAAFKEKRKANFKGR